MLYTYVKGSWLPTPGCVGVMHAFAICTGKKRVSGVFLYHSLSSLGQGLFLNLEFVVL